jgi:hypothetical protein
VSENTLCLVFSNSVEGKDREFNEWYDAVHVPEVLGLPGVLSAQRFDVGQPTLDPAADATLPAPAHRYLTVYEVDGDIEKVLSGLAEGATSGRMHMSDSLDVTSASIVFWKPRGAAVKL